MLTCGDPPCAGELELRLARAALALGMRCASPQLRHRWQGLTTSLLDRLHHSSAAAAGRMRVRAAGGVFGKNMRKGFPSDEPEADQAGMALPFNCHIVDIGAIFWVIHVAMNVASVHATSMPTPA